MKLLLIEDHEECARITKALLLEVDHEGDPWIEAIEVIPDLQTAVRRVPEFDMVVCDGEFPNEPGSRFVFKNWPAIWALCQMYRKPFLLYSGDGQIVTTARASAIPALEKPAKGDVLYEAIIDVFRSSARQRAA